MSESVGAAVKGSRIAVDGSGTSSMSDLSIACQPLIEEPSKPSPSANADSSKALSGSETCCQRPSRSTNLRSTILVSTPSANSSASFGAAEVPASRYCLSSISMSAIWVFLPIRWSNKKGPEPDRFRAHQRKKARTNHVLRPHCLDEHLRWRFVCSLGCRDGNRLSSRGRSTSLRDAAETQVAPLLFFALRFVLGVTPRSDAATRVSVLGIALAVDGGSESGGQGNDEGSGDFGSRRPQARSRERASRRRTDGPA